MVEQVERRERSRVVSSIEVEVRGKEARSAEVLDANRCEAANSIVRTHTRQGQVDESRRSAQHVTHHHKPKSRSPTNLKDCSTSLPHSGLGIDGGVDR